MKHEDAIEALRLYFEEVQKIATHEAGHVVQAAMEARFPHRIVLEPDVEAGSAARVHVDPNAAQIAAHTGISTFTPLEAKIFETGARQTAAYYVAGLVAEVSLGLNEREAALPFAADDLSNARYILDIFFPDRVEEELAIAEAEVTALFERPEVRSLLVWTAEELESLMQQGDEEVEMESFTKALLEQMDKAGLGCGDPRTIDPDGGDLDELRRIRDACDSTPRGH